MLLDEVTSTRGLSVHAVLDGVLHVGYLRIELFVELSMQLARLVKKEPLTISGA
jgi:hypothetical protein